MKFEIMILDNCSIFTGEERVKKISLQASVSHIAILYNAIVNLEKEDMNERMRLLNEENHTLLVNLKELNVSFLNFSSYLLAKLPKPPKEI
jgi:hypothetical protein